MKIPMITKRQFNKIAKFFPVPRGHSFIPALVFISCVIWIVRTNSSWSQLPEKYGKYDSIRKKFNRWSKKGIFRKIFSTLALKCGKRNIAMIDGLPRKIGKSKGGFTTKIHLIANIEEKPLDFSLTGGQVNDSKEGKSLLAKNISRLRALIADKGYDTNSIREQLEKRKIKSCIPPKSNRKNKYPYDHELYKKRAKIENMFGKLKDWLGIALRRCRCAHVFDSYVCIALTMIFFCVR